MRAYLIRILKLYPNSRPEFKSPTNRRFKSNDERYFRSFGILNFRNLKIEKIYVQWFCEIGEGNEAIQRSLTSGGR